jgi:hypothetical protein
MMSEAMGEVIDAKHLSGIYTVGDERIHIAFSREVHLLVTNISSQAKLNFG